MTNGVTNINPFDDNRFCGGRSALVDIIPSDEGRFEFKLLIQYTRQGLHSFQIGDLVAVENYTPPQKSNKIYSILTITQLYPIHYAQQGPDAYPGHVFESMRSIKEDWEKQENRPLFPTTIITAQAVSTGWQFTYDPKSTCLPGLDEEVNLPMVGADIRPLGMEMVETIINQGFSNEPDSPLVHQKFEDIIIKLERKSLLTTHFGIFGFTNVGKSNLISSLVTSLTANEIQQRPNIVIIDPNDEYLGLLIDRFIDDMNGITYVNVGHDSLSPNILPYCRELQEGESQEIPIEIINTLIEQMKLPLELKNNPELRNYLVEGLNHAIRRTKIVLLGNDMVSWLHSEILREIPDQTGPPARAALRDVEEAWTRTLIGDPINIDSINRAIQIARQTNNFDAQIRHLQGSPLATSLGIILRTIRELIRLQTNIQVIPTEAIISMDCLINLLNNPDQNQIIIITARRTSELKQFATMFGNELYEIRRRDARLTPFTTFLLDEADLFIPVDDKDEDTKEIKEMCVTLARRGRKFGLGIGIATQRASLLDTEVMGNLHTYFVSKLPRVNDREKVAEAFGIGQEQLTPTFTFRPGKWLIISHDATGLKGVPIPVIANNANERIIREARRYNSRGQT